MMSRRHVLVIAACLTLAACGRDPSSPAATPTNDDVATTLDDIAREQAQRGDATGGREIAWAALALREGIEPSELVVRNDGATQVYRAFVQALSLPTPTAVVPVMPRLLIAWRKVGDTTQVLTISSIQDEAPVLHPWSMGPSIASPLAGAQVSFLAASRRPTFWVGVSGSVKIAPRSLGDACLVPSSDKHRRPKGVECQKAEFTVAFDATVQRIRNEPRQVDPDSPKVRLTASEQTVNGVKLTFTCVLPERDKGCR